MQREKSSGVWLSQRKTFVGAVIFGIALLPMDLCMNFLADVWSEFTFSGEIYSKLHKHMWQYDELLQ